MQSLTEGDGGVVAGAKIKKGGAESTICSEKKGGIFFFFKSREVMKMRRGGRKEPELSPGGPGRLMWHFNIAFFVYGAYNSHAKGTVLF